ncbi:HAMP domain-containing sensor histidine kinase [Niameybacter massiliensis]|uniref:histidine kinase n=1 Tax=Holtiella tumoricola TaxID=3018743 RepID=A0AA42J3R5_9FIRM|nr:HAMP domain-containing sensor histidine kinase [Holtiella tumoricola]MDA3734088.1 HAMP domain-containing sensor histidine kinase [Holtiella tumoricola]
MKISIKVKFSIFLLTLLIFTMGILDVLILKGIHTNQVKEYEVYLASQAKMANSYIRQMNLLNPLENQQEFLQQNGQNIILNLHSLSGIEMAIYDMQGNVITHSVSYPVEMENESLLVHALNNEIAYQMVGGYIDYMAPLYGDGQIGVIQFHYSLKGYIEFYESIKALFIEIGAVVFLLSFISAYAYFNTFSKDIIKIKKEVLKIKRGQYDNAIPLKRNDEIGELSEGIYYMSNEIERNIKNIQEDKEQLKHVIDKLKILEQQQKTFIGNITHEFKTPLTVIKTYIDLLNIYTDDHKLLEDAKINIGKETQRLYEMVEKILYLSAMQQYDFECHFEHIDVKEVLEDVCSRMEGKAKKFNISLIRSLGHGWILGDQQNLIHIFINLIDNAIKYNRINGKIFITSYTKDQRVYIEIRDTGIGIAKEEKDKIFEPFYTVNKDRSKEYGGTGLGLSLVQELVRKQQGTIALLDDLETTFLITFPKVEKFTV